METDIQSIPASGIVSRNILISIKISRTYQTSSVLFPSLSTDIPTAMLSDAYEIGDKLQCTKHTPGTLTETPLFFDEDSNKQNNNRYIPNNGMYRRKCWNS